jgi:hypothetical protein
VCGRSPRAPRRPALVDRLESSRHAPGLRHRARDRRVVDAELARDGDGAQHVEHVEAPRQRGPQRQAADREARAVKPEVHVLGAQVGLVTMPIVTASKSAASLRPYGSSTLITAAPGPASNRRRLAPKYASMSGWKSRWSCVRFVKTATAQWIASARCSSSACEETSIAHATSPPSSISRNVRCRSIASGVVRIVGASTPAITDVTVPSCPVCRPAVSSSARTM